MSPPAPPWIVPTIFCVFPLWWGFVIWMMDRLSPLNAIRKAYPNARIDPPPMNVGSARIGLMSYSRCMRIALTEEGVFLKVIFPFSWSGAVTFIPLAEVRNLKSTGLLRRWGEFEVGSPPITTIRIPRKVLESSPLAARMPKSG